MRLLRSTANERRVSVAPARPPLAVALAGECGLFFVRVLVDVEREAACTPARLPGGDAAPDARAADPPYLRPDPCGKERRICTPPGSSGAARLSFASGSSNVACSTIETLSKNRRTDSRGAGRADSTAPRPSPSEKNLISAARLHEKKSPGALGLVTRRAREKDELPSCDEHLSDPTERPCPSAGEPCLPRARRVSTALQSCRGAVGPVEAPWSAVSPEGARRAKGAVSGTHASLSTMRPPGGGGRTSTNWSDAEQASA